MDMLWAPGRSEAAGDILRHLTRWEKVELAGLSLMFGVFAFAAPLVVMMSAVGAGPFQAAFEGYALPIVIALAVGIVGIFALRRRILSQTRAVREHGYTMAEIKARRPLSRGDKIALGALAVLAVALTLTFALMSL